MNKIKGLVLLTRPLNCLITMIAVWAGAVISSEIYYSINICLASISATLIAAFGFIINDIFDMKIDSINKPQRQLVSGKVSTGEAIFLAAVLVLSGLIISAFITVSNFIVAIAMAALLTIYTPLFKPIPFLGNTIIAAISSMAFIYGAMAVNNPLAPGFIVLFSFLYHFAREIIKDLEDRDADSRILPGSHRQRRTKTNIPRIIATVTIIGLIALTMVPYLIELYGLWYLIIVVAGVDTILMVISIELIRTDDISTMRRLAILMKIPMPLGMLAVLLGSLGF